MIGADFNSSSTPAGRAGEMLAANAIGNCFYWHYLRPAIPHDVTANAAL